MILGKPPCSKPLNATAGGMDRISSLPETLMVHIVSFLGIRDQIRTGVLSRTWKNICYCVPKLSISYCLDDTPSDKTEFVNFIDKTLILCKGTRLESFRVVWFPYNGVYASSVNLWARLAVKNGTDKFELTFAGQQQYKLPQFLFTNKSVKELQFRNCIVNPIVPVTWNSLKKLTLVRIATLSEDAIQRILAGTPVLEILELNSVKGFKSLHFGTSSTVKELAVNYQGSDFELSAPNLQSLEIIGHFSGYIKLADLTSLVKVSLDEAYLDDNSSVVGTLEFARQLLTNILHVETLMLGTPAIEGVARLCPIGGLPKWKNLTINTHLWVTKPQPIATLLKSCPNLETLIITMSGHSSSTCLRASRKKLNQGHEFWKSQKSVFNGLKLLTTVEFVQFWLYRDINFSVAEFLLEKTSTLQKLIVDMKTSRGQGCTTRDVHEATQMLLRMPRSSRDAEIVVS